jgi:hypothetical protein
LLLNKIKNNFCSTKQHVLDASTPPKLVTTTPSKSTPMTSPKLTTEAVTATVNANDQPESHEMTTFMRSPLQRRHQPLMDELNAKLMSSQRTNL